MRRAFALDTALTLAATAASAESWTKFVDGPNGTTWSYDSDYTYKDKQTGRIVVMQAVAKPEAKIGPSGPGKADGVGYVYAIDCSNKNLISLGAYTPSKPLEIKGSWRSDKPKKAEGPENAALFSSVCPHAEHVPVK